MAPAAHNVTPAVSVLLSIYNGADRLAQSLDSIFTQTWSDFEVIAVNDASTDETGRILKSWQAQHPRLRIVTNETNLGLTRSLNRGLRCARGAYIARQDADDIWLPQKLEKQMAFLRSHPHCGLVGCYYLNRSAGGDVRFTLPQTDSEIKHLIFRRNPFGHSCVLIRHELLRRVNGYNERVYYGQDRDLWFRLMPLTRFANLPEFLCIRRAEHTLSTRHTRAQMWQGIKTRCTYLRRYRAPLHNYLYLAEPLLIIITPAWLKRAARRHLTKRARLMRAPHT